MKPRNTSFRLGAARINMLLLKNIPNLSVRLRMWLTKKVQQQENRVNYNPELHLFWYKRPLE